MAVDPGHGHRGLREHPRLRHRLRVLTGDVPQHHLPHQCDSAQAYLAARGDINGQILDQDAAVERGRRNFGSLLGGTV